MSADQPPPYSVQTKYLGSPPQYAPGAQPSGYQAQAYQAGGYQQQRTVVMTPNVRQQYEFKFYQFIPILHIAPAVVGLVFNILGSGLGSMIAGFCIFCCGGHTYLTTQSKGLLCFLCFGAGLLQMATFMVSAVGYIWAVVWGILFVYASQRYYGHQIDPTQTQTVATIMTA